MEAMRNRDELHDGQKLLILRSLKEGGPFSKKFGTRGISAEWEN